MNFKQPPRAWTCDQFYGLVLNMCYHNQYVYVDLDDDPNTYCVGNSRLYHMDEVDLQYATGKKDRNGKLIYEGDLVESMSGIIAEVCWNKFKWTIKGKGHDGKSFKYDLTEGRAKNCCTIVGTKYENPELIGG